MDMEGKENVLIENFSKTEQLDTNGRGRVEMNAEKGSTGLGKFKDQNALLNAYGALEAEFTRRSQRLKELERSLAKLQEKAEKPKEAELDVPSDGTQADAPSTKIAVEPESVDGDGKPTLDNRRAGTAKDASPIEIADGEKAVVRGSEEILATEKAQGDEGFDGREIDLPIEKPKEMKEDSESELYRKATGNESVRLKIIGEYLASLRRSDAPLMKGGFGTVATPIAKAKTISQAGSLALSYLKNDKG